MKKQTIIAALAIFAAAAAITVKSQPGRLDRTVPSAVILRIDEVGNYDSGHYEGDRQIVLYSSVSSNAPAIPAGMNAADAIAIAMSDGRRCILSQYGFLVFAGN